MNTDKREIHKDNMVVISRVSTTALPHICRAAREADPMVFVEVFYTPEMRIRYLKKEKVVERDLWQVNLYQEKSEEQEGKS